MPMCRLPLGCTPEKTLAFIIKRTSIVKDVDVLSGKASSSPATVRVEKLVYGGDGLARVDGQVLLVPYVLPGEEVAVEVKRANKGMLRGTISTVLEPAATRVAPSCEYFGNCGGCLYQHASYPAQLDAKTAILRETLGRLASLQFEGDIPVVSGEPWGYRNRIQLHFSDGTCGFRHAGSRDICPIDHCPISSPLLNQAITEFAKAAQRAQWPKFLNTLEVFTNEADIQLTVVDSARPVAIRFFEWCGTFLPGLAAGAIDYAVAGHSFRISRGSFFQVNRFLVDELINAVIGDLEGETAIDLYAGVGLFTRPLAKRFREVHGVERGGPAFRDLQWNTREQENVIAEKGSAEELLSELEQAPELVLADPPRAGLDKQVTTELLRLKPAKLVLVSCDPTTLARDLKALMPAYSIDRLTLIDLFPQTYHFETIAHLSTN